jgi:hypothetical protein
LSDAKWPFSYRSSVVEVPPISLKYIVMVQKITSNWLDYLGDCFLEGHILTWLEEVGEIPGKYDKDSVELWTVNCVVKTKATLSVRIYCNPENYDPNLGIIRCSPDLIDYFNECLANLSSWKQFGSLLIALRFFDWAKSSVPVTIENLDELEGKVRNLLLPTDRILSEHPLDIESGRWRKP